VGDLLGAESGLFVVGAGQTPGTNQNIFMRGTNSNQVAVLVDGVRITDPSSPNSAIDLSEMSLTNVERIEVLRGSHSTIFGGAAVGGVINIITRKSTASGLHGNVSWQGSSLGEGAWSSSENATLNYGTGDGFYVNGAIFRQDVKGLNGAADQMLPSFSADRDDFRKSDVALKGGFKDEVWDANISWKSVHQYTEVDDGAFRDDENNILEFDRRLLQYYGARKISSALTVSLLGSFSESERFFEDDSSRVDQATWDHLYSRGTYYGRLQTHELQLNYTKGRIQGVFGGGLYREKMFFDSYLFFNDPSFSFELVTNYDTIDSRTSTGYLFGQLSYKVRRFNLSGGLRISRHTTAGNFLTFELDPSWTFDDLLVYAALSTGFNAPSLYQLYDPSRNFGAYASRGNSSLRPEESVSLEVGIKKQFTSGSYFTVSAYTTRVNNAIEYVYLWNGDKPIGELDYTDDRGDRYLNVARQNVRGIELEGFVNLGSKVSLQGNLSALEAEVHASPEDVSAADTGGNHVQLYNLGRFLDADLSDDRVVRRPGLTAFSTVSYRPVGDVTLHVIYRYTGKRFDAGYNGSLGPYGALSKIEVEAYHLVDAGVNWKASRLLTTALKVENIFDEDYREVLGFRTRGRSVTLKLSLTF
jgi:vitamin B12 transporter